MTTTPSVADERNFRPKTLIDFIGQTGVKKTLGLMLSSARKRSSVLEQVVFFGPPGLGKTTLAATFAAEMSGRMFELSASSVKKAGDFASRFGSNIQTCFSAVNPDSTFIKYQGRY
jgi:Holliday junction DNA helicase RuvB